MYLPKEAPALFDLSEFLYKGLILKEKEYRLALSETDWRKFSNKTALVYCSTDAIIPVWAYMLAAANLATHATEVFLMNEDQWREFFILHQIRQLNTKEYIGARVVIKGCGETKVPDAAYVEITNRLLPVVKTILYGEPCSTVPVYKKK